MQTNKEKSEKERFPFPSIDIYTTQNSAMHNA